jgi:hypothetical protein
MLQTILLEALTCNVDNICAVLIKAYESYGSESNCPLEVLLASHPCNVSCFVPYGLQDASTQGGLLEFAEISQTAAITMRRVQQILRHRNTHAAAALTRLASKRFFTNALLILEHRLDYESEQVQKAVTRIASCAFSDDELLMWHTIVNTSADHDDCVLHTLTLLTHANALEQWRLLNFLFEMGQ